MTARAANIWHSPIVRALAAAVPLWPTLAVLIFGAPASLKIPVVASLALALISPYHALLAVAAVVPLADYIGIVLNLGSYRLGEAVTVAFLAGWILRGEPDRRGPRTRAAIGWTLAAVLIASMAITAVRSTDGIESVLRWAYYGYFLAADPSGWVDGARLLEGVALVAIVFATLRRRPLAAISVPAALAVSLLAAGLTSCLLRFGIGPQTVLERHRLIGYRYTAHVADVNAAGSYFVLCICVALGMAVRAPGRKRLPWIGASALGLAGAWLAGSRAANGAAAAAILSAALWYMAGAWPRRAKIGLATAAAILVTSGGAFQIRELMRDRDYRSADFRQQFNATSVRMIAAAPAAGVGIGQYRQASALFLGPAVAYSYGSENAHNYFLQLAAEIGLLGFAVVGWWLGTGIARTLRAASVSPRDGRLLGLAAGTLAFIGTWATGHPLLLTEVAVPFWIAFGLMWALAEGVLVGDESPVSRRRWETPAAAVVAVVFVVAALAAPDVTLRPPQSRVITGLFDWEEEADGTRYRWTGEYGSLFVPFDVTRIYIPVRAPAVSPAVSPMPVEVRTAGRPGTRLMVGDGWATIDLPLPDAGPNARFKRINLHVDHTWQPAVYRAGSSDMRELGIEVGEIKLFRER